MIIQRTTYQLASSGGWAEIESERIEPDMMFDAGCSEAVAMILTSYPGGSVAITNGTDVYENKRLWRYRLVTS